MTHFQDHETSVENMIVVCSEAKICRALNLYVVRQFYILYSLFQDSRILFVNCHLCCLVFN